MAAVVEVVEVAVLAVVGLVPEGECVLRRVRWVEVTLLPELPIAMAG